MRVCFDGLEAAQAASSSLAPPAAAAAASLPTFPSLPSKLECKHTLVLRSTAITNVLPWSSAVTVVHRSSPQQQHNQPRWHKSNGLLPRRLLLAMQGQHTAAGEGSLTHVAWPHSLCRCPAHPTAPASLTCTCAAACLLQICSAFCDCLTVIFCCPCRCCCDCPKVRPGATLSAVCSCRPAPTL